MKPINKSEPCRIFVDQKKDYPVARCDNYVWVKSFVQLVDDVLSFALLCKTQQAELNQHTSFTLNTLD